MSEQSSNDSSLDTGSDEAPTLESKVVTTLKTIYDPEIPVDIYELGLIYGIDVRDDHFVQITMTLTSPNCPVAESLPSEVKQKVSEVDGVTGSDVEIVWDPTWTPEKMSEAARIDLNMW